MCDRLLWDQGTHEKVANFVLDLLIWCFRAYVWLLPDLLVLLRLLEGGQLHLLSLLLLQHFHLQLLQELAVLIIQPGLLQLEGNAERRHMEREKGRRRGSFIWAFKHLRLMANMRAVRFQSDPTLPSALKEALSPSDYNNMKLKGLILSSA